MSTKTQPAAEPADQKNDGAAQPAAPETAPKQPQATVVTGKNGTKTQTVA